MEIKKLIEELNSLLEGFDPLLEFKREHAGEKIEFKDFHDAVEQLYIKYKNEELFAYCENVLSKNFKYKGKEIELCLIIGGEIEEKEKDGETEYSIVCKSGFGHAMLHTGEVEGEIITEQKLKNAIKELPNALKYGKWYDEYEIVHKNEKECIDVRLLIDYNNFVYIIAFADDETEFNYLLNAFKPDKNYIKNKLDNNTITPIEKG